MTRTERLLRLARQRGDRAAELILQAYRDCTAYYVDGGRPYWKCDEWAYTVNGNAITKDDFDFLASWTEAELREAWGR